jgi:hypothetical protein
LEQIEEAYKFMNTVFVKHAAEIIRVSLLPPTSPKTEEPAKTTKAKHLWVPHPSPRNIVNIALEKVIEA